MNNIRIASKSEISRHIEFVNSMKEDGISCDTNVEKVKNKNWVIVPLETGMHLCDEDISLMLDYLSGSCDKLIAVSLDESFCPHYVIDLNESGLSEFNLLCWKDDYVLLPTGHSFMIWCFMDDYLLYVGSRETVELLVGTTIKEAWRKFRVFIQKENNTHSINVYMEVLEKYRDFDEFWNLYPF